MIGTSGARGSSAGWSTEPSAWSLPGSGVVSGVASRISLTIAAAEANDCPPDRKKSGVGWLAVNGSAAVELPTAPSLPAPTETLAGAGGAELAGDEAFPCPLVVGSSSLNWSILALKE